MPYQLALLDPVGVLTDTAGRLIGTRRQDQNPVVVVFIVAVAILLAINAVMSIATMIYCLQKHGSFSWQSTNGWRFWEMKVACRFG